MLTAEWGQLSLKVEEKSMFRTLLMTRKELSHMSVKPELSPWS